MFASSSNSAEKMKVGFQLNGSSKRKKIVDDSSTGECDGKREKILHIEGNILQTDITQSQASQSSASLVIPLPPPRNLSTSTTRQLLSEKNEKNEKGSSNLDDLAAQEILADLKGPSNPESTLVIDAVKSKGDVNAPLLLANVAPELMSITNDDERFKVDVSLRAENLDVNSDIYQSIPIDQFGAAMLRGMGWTGPSPDEEKDENKYKVVPRESRLGLGATPKPPEEKKKSLHPDRYKATTNQEKKTEGWKKKAEEHLEKQKLYVSLTASPEEEKLLIVCSQVDDVVWLIAPVELAGTRAIIVQTTGVPGLGKVRLVSLSSLSASL
jgi:hypothetical protein